MKRPSVSWLIVPLAVAMTGCATSGPTLSSSVDRLEDTSFALEKHASERSVRLQARDLSEEARDFRRTLIHYRSQRLDVGEAFDELSREYHALRDAVERSRDRDAEHYFEPITNAYLDIEREVDRGNQRASVRASLD